jgi:hypothetical protein
MFIWDLLVSILEISLRMRIMGKSEERGWVSGRSHMIKKIFLKFVKSLHCCMIYL